MDNHTQRFMDECKPGQRIYQVILRDGKKRASFGFWDKASFEDRLLQFKRKRYTDVVLQAGRVNVQGWAALTIMSWDDFRQKNWETLQVESLVSTEPGL